MKLERATLPINLSNITSLSTPAVELNGEPIVFDADMHRNPIKAIDIKTTLGECILYPNTLYYATINLNIRSEEVRYIKDLAANPELPLIGIKVDLSVNADQTNGSKPASIVLVITTVMKIKINFDQISLAEIIFEYDAENVPKFLQKTTQIEEVTETPYVAEPEVTAEVLSSDEEVLASFDEDVRAQREAAAAQLAAQQTTGSAGTIFERQEA